MPKKYVSIYTLIGQDIGAVRQATRDLNLKGRLTPIQTRVWTQGEVDRIKAHLENHDGRTQEPEVGSP